MYWMANKSNSRFCVNVSVQKLRYRKLTGFRWLPRC